MAWILIGKKFVKRVLLSPGKWVLAAHGQAADELILEQDCEEHASEQYFRFAKDTFERLNQLHLKIYYTSFLDENERLCTISPLYMGNLFDIFQESFSTGLMRLSNTTISKFSPAHSKPNTPRFQFDQLRVGLTSMLLYDVLQALNTALSVLPFFRTLHSKKIYLDQNGHLHFSPINFTVLHYLAQKYEIDGREEIPEQGEQNEALHIYEYLKSSKILSFQQRLRLRKFIPSYLFDSILDSGDTEYMSFEQINICCFGFVALNLAFGPDFVLYCLRTYFDKIVELEEKALQRFDDNLERQYNKNRNIPDQNLKSPHSMVTISEAGQDSKDIEPSIKHSISHSDQYIGLNKKQVSNSTNRPRAMSKEGVSLKHQDAQQYVNNKLLARSKSIEHLKERTSINSVLLMNKINNSEGSSISPSKSYGHDRYSVGEYEDEDRSISETLYSDGQNSSNDKSGDNSSSSRHAMNKQRMKYINKFRARLKREWRKELWKHIESVIQSIPVLTNTGKLAQTNNSAKIESILDNSQLRKAQIFTINEINFTTKADEMEQTQDSKKHQNQSQTGNRNDKKLIHTDHSPISHPQHHAHHQNQSSPYPSSHIHHSPQMHSSYAHHNTHSNKSLHNSSSPLSLPIHHPTPQQSPESDMQDPSSTSAQNTLQSNASPNSSIEVLLTTFPGDKEQNGQNNSLPQESLVQNISIVNHSDQSPYNQEQKQNHAQEQEQQQIILQQESTKISSSSQLQKQSYQLSNSCISPSNAPSLSVCASSMPSPPITPFSADSYYSYSDNSDEQNDDDYASPYVVWKIKENAFQPLPSNPPKNFIDLIKLCIWGRIETSEEEERDEIQNKKEQMQQQNLGEKNQQLKDNNNIDIKDNLNKINIRLDKIIDRLSDKEEDHNDEFGFKDQSENESEQHIYTRDVDLKDLHNHSFFNSVRKKDVIIRSSVKQTLNKHPLSINQTSQVQQNETLSKLIQQQELNLDDLQNQQLQSQSFNDNSAISPKITQNTPLQMQENNSTNSEIDKLNAGQIEQDSQQTISQQQQQQIQNTQQQLNEKTPKSGSNSPMQPQYQLLQSMQQVASKPSIVHQSQSNLAHSQSVVFDDESLKTQVKKSPLIRSSSQTGQHVIQSSLQSQQQQLQQQVPIQNAAYSAAPSIPLNQFSPEELAYNRKFLVAICTSLQDYSSQSQQPRQQNQVPSYPPLLLQEDAIKREKMENFIQNSKRVKQRLKEYGFLKYENVEERNIKMNKGKILAKTLKTREINKILHIKRNHNHRFIIPKHNSNIYSQNTQSRKSNSNSNSLSSSLQIHQQQQQMHNSLDLIEQQSSKKLTLVSPSSYITHQVKQQNEIFPTSNLGQYHEGSSTGDQSGENSQNIQVLLENNKESIQNEKEKEKDIGKDKDAKKDKQSNDKDKPDQEIEKVKNEEKQIKEKIKGKEKDKKSRSMDREGDKEKEKEKEKSKSQSAERKKEKEKQKEKQIRLAQIANNVEIDQINELKDNEKDYKDKDMKKEKEEVNKNSQLLDQHSSNSLIILRQQQKLRQLKTENKHLKQHLKNQLSDQQQKNKKRKSQKYQQHSINEIVDKKTEIKQALTQQAEKAKGNITSIEKDSIDINKEKIESQDEMKNEVVQKQIQQQQQQLQQQQQQINNQNGFRRIPSWHQVDNPQNYDPLGRYAWGMQPMPAPTPYSMQMSFLPRPVYAPSSGYGFKQQIIQDNGNQLTSQQQLNAIIPSSSSQQLPMSGYNQLAIVPHFTPMSISPSQQYQEHPYLHPTFMQQYYQQQQMNLQQIYGNSQESMFGIQLPNIQLNSHIFPSGQMQNSILSPTGQYNNSFFQAFSQNQYNSQFQNPYHLQMAPFNQFYQGDLVYQSMNEGASSSMTRPEGLIDQQPFSVDSYSRKLKYDSERTCVLGICCMDKKAQSKPMQEIFKRIVEHGDIKILTFGEQVIIDRPITEWPLCDILLAFYSEGFPIQKAIEYVKLRNPFQINDLIGQLDLFYRDKIYERLLKHNIAVPRFAVVYRDAQGFVNPTIRFIEFPDKIIIGNITMQKPFVEKPLNAEDHNVWLYYSPSQGGGVRKLFRKQGDKSSEFDPGINQVRTDQSYLYEQFIDVDNAMDVKVYAVLPDYVHCELRKTPTLDGLVERDENKKEVRRLTPTTDEERRYAQMIGKIFKQRVCGFDFLRKTINGKTRTYVCDVNGWSFVKGDTNYFEGVARILRNLMLQAKARLRQPAQPISDADREGAQLKRVFCLVRYGEYEPKQKMKVLLNSQYFRKLIEFFRTVGDTRMAQIPAFAQVSSTPLSSSAQQQQRSLQSSPDSSKAQLQQLQVNQNVQNILNKQQLNPLVFNMQNQNTNQQQPQLNEGQEQDLPDEDLLDTASRFSKTIYESDNQQNDEKQGMGMSDSELSNNEIQLTLQNSPNITQQQQQQLKCKKSNLQSNNNNFSNLLSSTTSSIASSNTSNISFASQSIFSQSMSIQSQQDQSKSTLSSQSIDSQTQSQQIHPNKFSQLTTSSFYSQPQAQLFPSSTLIPSISNQQLPQLQQTQQYQQTQTLYSSSSQMKMQRRMSSNSQNQNKGDFYACIKGNTAFLEKFLEILKEEYDNILQSTKSRRSSFIDMDNQKDKKKEKDKDKERANATSPYTTQTQISQSSTRNSQYNDAPVSPKSQTLPFSFQNSAFSPALLLEKPKQQSQQSFQQQKIQQQFSKPLSLTPLLTESKEINDQNVGNKGEKDKEKVKDSKKETIIKEDKQQSNQEINEIDQMKRPPSRVKNSPSSIRIVPPVINASQSSSQSQSQTFPNQVSFSPIPSQTVNVVSSKEKDDKKSQPNPIQSQGAPAFSERVVDEDEQPEQLHFRVMDVATTPEEVIESLTDIIAIVQGGRRGLKLEARTCEVDEHGNIRGVYDETQGANNNINTANNFNTNQINMLQQQHKHNNGQNKLQTPQLNYSQNPSSYQTSQMQSHPYQFMGEELESECGSDQEYSETGASMTNYPGTYEPVTYIVLTCRWGGTLSHSGFRTAQALGFLFRKFYTVYARMQVRAKRLKVILPNKRLKVDNFSSNHINSLVSYDTIIGNLNEEKERIATDAEPGIKKDDSERELGRQKEKQQSSSQILSKVQKQDQSSFRDSLESISFQMMNMNVSQTHVNSLIRIQSPPLFADNQVNQQRKYEQEIERDVEEGEVLELIEKFDEGNNVCENNSNSVSHHSSDEPQDVGEQQENKEIQTNEKDMTAEQQPQRIETSNNSGQLNEEDLETLNLAEMFIKNTKLHTTLKRRSQASAIGFSEAFYGGRNSQEPEPSDLDNPAKLSIRVENMIPMGALHVESEYVRQDKHENARIRLWDMKNKLKSILITNREYGFEYEDFDNPIIAALLSSGLRKLKNPNDRLKTIRKEIWAFIQFLTQVEASEIISPSNSPTPQSPDKKAKPTERENRDRIKEGQSQSLLLRDNQSIKERDKERDMSDNELFRKYLQQQQNQLSSSQQQKNQSQILNASFVGCGGESLTLIKQRWKRLAKMLWREGQEWNTAVIIPIYQNLKWDITHNPVLASPLSQLYQAVQPLAIFLIPLEYGILRRHRAQISADFSGELVQKIMKSLFETNIDTQPTSEFLFIDESALVGFIDQIILSGLPGLHADSLAQLGELNYSSYVLFKVYTNPKGLSWAEVSLSTGISDNPYQLVGASHCLPVNEPISIHDAIRSLDAKTVFLGKNQQVRKETLKGIVAVFRHGDRKPKQKIKLIITNPKLLNTLFTIEAFNEIDMLKEEILKGDILERETFDKKEFVRKFLSNGLEEQIDDEEEGKEQKKEKKKAKKEKKEKDKKEKEKMERENIENIEKNPQEIIKEKESETNNNQNEKDQQKDADKSNTDFNNTQNNNGLNVNVRWPENVLLKQEYSSEQFDTLISIIMEAITEMQEKMYKKQIGSTPRASRSTLSDSENFQPNQQLISDLLLSQQQNAQNQDLNHAAPVLSMKQKQTNEFEGFLNLHAVLSKNFVGTKVQSKPLKVEKRTYKISNPRYIEKKKILLQQERQKRLNAKLRRNRHHKMNIGNQSLNFFHNEDNSMRSHILSGFSNNMNQTIHSSAPKISRSPTLHEIEKEKEKEKQAISGLSSKNSISGTDGNINKQQVNNQAANSSLSKGANITINSPNDFDGEPEFFTRTVFVVTEALFIVKWGGSLTHAGLQQSKQLGRLFREAVLPEDKAESHTFLENLKIRTNGERRVQRTARSFAEALFGFDSHQPAPILHSPELLDNIPDEAREMLLQIKKRLKKLIMLNYDFSITTQTSRAKIAGSTTDPAMQQTPQSMFENSSNIQAIPSIQINQQESDKSRKTPPIIITQAQLQQVQDEENKKTNESTIKQSSVQKQATNDDIHEILDNEKENKKDKDKSKGKADNNKDKEKDKSKEQDKDKDQEKETPKDKEKVIEFDRRSQKSQRSQSLERDELAQGQFGTSDLQLIEDIKQSQPWGLQKLGNPLSRLVRLDRGIKTMRDDLARKVAQYDPTQYYAPFCEHESLRTLLHRWEKASVDLHDEELDIWDPSKIGDIYDSLRFDIIHMKDVLSRLSVPMDDLLQNTRALADFWVTQEFGISNSDKFDIGKLIAGPLLHEIITNIESAAFGSAPSVNLYFSSESHIQGLLNMIMLSGVEGILLERTQLRALDYLTHILFKVYEAEASKTFRVEIFLSAGAIALTPKIDLGQTHSLPIESPMLVHENLTLPQLRQILEVVKAPSVGTSQNQNPFLFSQIKAENALQQDEL